MITYGGENNNRRDFLRGVSVAAGSVLVGDLNSAEVPETESIRLVGRVELAKLRNLREFPVNIADLFYQAPNEEKKTGAAFVYEGAVCIHNVDTNKLEILRDVSEIYLLQIMDEGFSNESAVLPPESFVEKERKGAPFPADEMVRQLNRFKGHLPDGAVILSDGEIFKIQDGSVKIVGHYKRLFVAKPS